MNSVFRTLAKDSIVYGLGSAVSGLTGFVLLPILVRTLYAMEYGRYALAETFLNGLLVVVGMGMSIVFPGQYLTRPASLRKGFVAGAICAAAAVSTALSTLLVGSMFVVDRWSGLNLPSVYYPLICAISVLEALWAIYGAWLRVEHEAWRFGILSFVQFATSLAATVALIMLAGRREEAILIGRLFADVLLAVYLLPRSLKLLHECDWKAGTRLASLGAPLVPATLATVWIAMSPRLLLEHFSTSTAVGVFSMSTKVSALASLLYIQPFSLAWMVMMFRLREHPNAPQMYAKVLTFYWLVGLLVALGLGVVAPGLVSLLGRREFPLSPSVVTVAALAAVLSGAMYPVNVGIYLRNRTSAVVPAFAACALLSVALGWAVVPTWGVTGAAACLLGTYAVQTFLLARINARLYPIPWEWMRLSKATGASVIAYGATLTFGGTNGSLALAIRGLVFCCTALLCLRVFRFFGEGELAAIWVSARRALD